jgi:flagellar biosynthesis protein
MTRRSPEANPLVVLKGAVGAAKGQRVNKAVALAYEANSTAPRVIAKGEGVVAEAILARAKEVGIPLKVEPEIVILLMQLELDTFIPPALYAAVAEILVWAYEIDGKSKLLDGST